MLSVVAQVHFSTLFVFFCRAFTFWYKYNKFRGSLLFTHFNEIESQSDRKRRRENERMLTRERDGLNTGYSLVEQTPAVAARSLDNRTEL